jgi:hypothetical protein
MDSALVSVNGHTEFFKKGISTGLKSGSVAEGRVNPSLSLEDLSLVE